MPHAWRMGAFGCPEFWNPTVKGSVCLNPQAARSILPIAYLRTKMVMAGRSKGEIVSAIKAAFENKQLPNLESGALAGLRFRFPWSDLTPNQRPFR
jgi:hypothetical protein